MQVKDLLDVLDELREDQELIFDGPLWVVEETIDTYDVITARRLRRLSDIK